MVTTVNHMARGKDSMLCRGSRRKINAEKNRVSSRSENRRIGNASKACSQAAITKRNRSKRRSVLSNRTTGTRLKRQSRAMPRGPTASLLGSTNPMAARSARGSTATKSIMLCRLETKTRRLGQVRKRKASSIAKIASNTVSSTAAGTPVSTSQSVVCSNVVATAKIVMAGITTAYQAAPLLESGLERKFHRNTKISKRWLWASRA
mmetsp:Transcript_76324/g.210679  ORF Transcript_76324/g.210679 Transcript_76324/m.210679 type:complete len:206 (+) Transcript_76324:733-1350(+)